MTPPDRTSSHRSTGRNADEPRRTMHDLRSSWRQQSSPVDLGEQLLGIGVGETYATDLTTDDANRAGERIGDARSGLGGSTGGLERGWGFRWGPGWLAASGAAAAVVALGMGLRFAVVPELPPAPPGQSAGVAGVGSGSTGVSAERLPTPPALPTVRALAVRPAGVSDALTPMRPTNPSSLSSSFSRPAALPSASMIKLPPRIASQRIDFEVESRPGANADRPAMWLAWFFRRPA